MRVISGGITGGIPGSPMPGISGAPRDVRPGGPAKPLKPLAASLNLGPTPGDVEGNLSAAEEAIRGAKRSRPALRWVVLPELYTCGYADLAGTPGYAEDAECGMSVWRLSALAHELGVFIAYGFPERLPDSGAASSANLVGPDGPGALVTYRKMNLVETTPERRVFTPGTELPVVEVGGLRVALVVCWDLGHPETVREATMKGANLILAPAAWRDPWGPQYDLACAARALDNAVYVASANQQGDYAGASFGSPGGVYGPDGSLVSETEGEAAFGEVCPESSRRWRERYGSTLGETSPFEEEACS